MTNPVPVVPTSFAVADSDLVVVSHGYANRFGHPHPAVKQRLRDNASAVYSTAAEGALTFNFEPSEPIEITGHRRQRRRYWM